jgi:hypothetical protein
MTHYGRLFPNQPFRPRRQRLEKLAERMFEDGDSPNGFSSIPSGYTYLGQFITHDLSFEQLPPDGDPVDPEEVQNGREPRLNLDSLYGGGPEGSPDFYEGDGAGMRVGWSNLAHGEDLPRQANGLAMINDSRNDENVIIAQLHLAFIKFHNRVVDVIRRRTGLKGVPLFAAAAKSVRHHYQWAVVHDFLPRFVTRNLIQTEFDRKDGGIFAGGEPFMPIEFSAAAFRFGHSMVRRQYMLEPWFSFPILSDDDRQQDLKGGHERRAGTLITDWSVFFGPEAQLARKIDVRVVRALEKVPMGPGRLDSLPRVDLQKAWRLGLRAGQTVADALELPDDQRLEPGHFGELKQAPADVQEFSVETPLWYYCLKEAEHFQNGSALGPVASRIVAQVVIGLLRADPQSYLHKQPAFQPDPKVGARQRPGGLTFGMRELLEFASGEPTSRREPSARGLVPMPR